MHNSCGTFFYFWRIQLSVFKEVADSSQAQPPSPPVEKFFPRTNHNINILVEVRAEVLRRKYCTVELITLITYS